MKITRSGKCKNSPKNASVEELVIELVTGANLAGKVEDSAALPRLPDGVSGVVITHAISHGKVGAANGAMMVKGIEIPFAVFVEFSSAKAALVKTLVLYTSASG